VRRIAAQLNCRIGRARQTEHFRQFLLEPEVPELGPALPLDLVRDFGPQYGQRQMINGIIVDAIENIGANKITAILGRTDAKDFVDLYFILQTGYDFDDLFVKAREKDTGLQPFYFAGALLQVRELQHLPAMLKPVDLPELQAYFIALANRLLDRLRPEDRPR